jgi:RimJ/RimL family protein N-acetyltransferase
MTDPSTALQLFQEAFLLDEIQVQSGELDKDLYVHADAPGGQARFTYVRLEGKTVTALVIFALCEPVDGTRCCAIGYAVPEAYRNQGRAKEVVGAAISEMQHIHRHPFYIEAIVGAENKPSQRVAEQTLSNKPLAVTDKVSGLPAFQYVRKVEPKAK